MNKSLYLRISKEIQELDEVPLFGNANPLDLSLLSVELAKQFGIEECSIQIKEQGWKNRGRENVKQVEVPIYLSPIDVPLYWSMTKTDRDKFLSQMMFQKQKKGAQLSPALQEGFYQFILLEALSAAQKLEPIRGMSLQLGEDALSDQEIGIEITVEISIGNFSTWGKLFITDSFRKTWIQHFSAFPRQYTSSILSKTLKLGLGIKVGEVDLSLKEWTKLKPGDIIFPDVFTPNTGIFVLGKTSLFTVERKENTQIEIKDFAFMNDEMMNDDEVMKPETLAHKLEISDELTPLKEASLNISIELARVKISLDELMKLSPGNLLEVPPLAEKKVTLVANGQKIGIAEIVELEDSLGLKILEI